MKQRLARIAARTALAAGAALLASSARCTDPASGAAAAQAVQSCAAEGVGLALPAGFCASIFADGIGHVRHLAVAASGDVYANTWSSAYTGMSNAEGGFLVALRDEDHDGHAEQVERFGSVYEQGKPGGGTGIALHGDALYAEVDDRIVRYPLSRDSLAPRGQPDIVLSGLPVDGDHPMHPFAIARSGALFVNSGSASNSCQLQNRARESPGRMPCPELSTRAGIWRYEAERSGQVFSPEGRMASGARNSVALAVRARDEALYAVMHGRDQLGDDWPRLYTREQSNQLPAEILARVEEQDDFGWPYCYFDAAQSRYVLAPEYGGDGGRTQGDCAQGKQPELSFPAHWAPEAIAFYSGSAFPEKYRNGVFVSFHGSWNRSPVQAGYLVAFVPFESGRPAGRYEEFATGFAGAHPPSDAERAAHRPMGLAVGPDGALYVSDDFGGRIWRITYGAGAGAKAPRPAAGD